ncbi:MAG: PKD domain-containing protein, partial [Bacteroidota bacterium]
VADVAEDSMVIEQGQQYFVVQVCGPGEVTFMNESFQQQFIDFRQWTFSIDSNLVTDNDWNGKFDFPHIGTFYGSLVLNPNTTCGDTAWLRVDVFPDIRADFEFDYDTCRAGPVSFTDLSVSDAGPNTIDFWDWDFGDGGSSAQQHPSHIYQEPGALPIALTVRDTNNCADTKTKTIQYFPVPELLVIAPSEFIGCQPASIFFDNLSFPVNESYTIAWEFGDGGTSSEISPTHLYTDLGTYSISLKITSPLGCETDTVWNDLITILPSPEAAFSYLPEQPSNLDPTVHFTDESTGAAKWKWTFGTAGGSTQQHPVFTFPYTGLQQIQLIVFHVSGCTDTAIQMLDVIPEVRYFLPNAFTPNGDGFNDGFRGTGSMEGATNFSLTIWNRYGEKLFETSDPDEDWNGKKNNTGNLAPQGVYVVVVNFRGPRGEKHELRGYATLVK